LTKEHHILQQEKKGKRKLLIFKSKKRQVNVLQNRYSPVQIRMPPPISPFPPLDSSILIPMVVLEKFY
jgi:hypothetical protein